MDTYKKIKVESRKMGESNDCAVVAMSIACDVPYEYAHEAIALQGRKVRRGTDRFQWKEAVRSVGGSIKGITYFHRTNIKSKNNLPEYSSSMREDGSYQVHVYVPYTVTMNHILKFVHPHKRYMVSIRDHVLAIVNGKVEDWTANSKRRVWDITEVEG